MAVRHHITVLVVDEDSNSLASTKATLDEHGYRPRLITTAAAGIEAAERESYQIAVVSLGLQSPTGLEVLERLNAINSRMAVIALTSQANLSEARDVMRRGACDYLVKPAQGSDLAEALDRACRKLGLVYTKEEDLNRLIGQRIRAARQEQELTLRQLSDRTQLTTSQLSQVELGKNAASIWALARISNALGRQMSEMLQGL